MNKILLIFSFCLLVSLLTQAQTAKLVNDEVELSDVQQRLSNQFKQLKNGNRVAIFDQLQSILVIDQKQTSVKPGLQAEATTVDALINLLGEPDRKIQKTIYEYNLNGAQKNCKLFVGVSAKGTITFVTVKNCQ